MSGLQPEAEESTPLLAVKEPFPYAHIIPLCFARLLEAWSFWTVVPFLPALLETKASIPQTDLGFYTGLIEGIFSAIQVVTMLCLSGVSERWGRKNVLCFCLLGLSICSCGFGFATTVPGMILFRSGSGMFSACTVTVRVMISESTQGEVTAKAFSYMTIAQSVAQIAAPSVAGLLWTGNQTTLSTSPMLAQYPALLACLVNGAIGMITLISTLLYVKDTRQNKLGASRTRANPVSYLRILRQPKVLPFLVIHTVEWASGSAVRAIQSLSWYTRVQYGGWGLSVREISWISGGLGLCGIIWSILFFPRVSTKLGTPRILTICAYNYVCIHFWAVLSNQLLRSHSYRIFYLLCPAFLISQNILGCSTAIAIQLLFNDIAPEGMLGPMYSLGYGLGAAQRAIVPAAVTSFYAYSVRRQILNGCLVFVILGAVGICYTIALRIFLRRHVYKV